MNHEIQFKKQYVADYTGMDMKEYTFAELKNRKGVLRDYKLDIMTAPERPACKQPVVIFIHGGGFTEPCDKRQAYIPVFARKYVEMGYVVVSPDYPVFDTEEERNAVMAAGMADVITPCAEAIVEVVHYLDAHADELGLDMTRLAIGGGSAGGMTSVYAAALLKDRVKCVINCWGSPEVLPELKDFPPVFSIHGTADPAVPYELETAFQQALENNAVEHELITLEGAAHTPIHLKDEYFPAMEAFIKKHV